MTKNLKEVTKELEASKGDHIKLILGQFAFEVEKAIVSEVFTKVIGSPVLATIILQQLQICKKHL